jgi:hypothetical protein
MNEKLINEKYMNEKLATIMGIFALLVVLYRIIYLMIPMLISGIKTGNVLDIFNSFTLIV